MHAETAPSALKSSDERSVYYVPIVVMSIVLGVALCYWPTVAQMVAIWNSSETFVYGYFVLPIFAWLLWRNREELAAVPLRPYPLALIGVLAMGFGWLLGEIAGMASPAQFALIGMMVCLVWALLGTRMLRELAFPLLILMFAVPFGEFMTPTLMEWTADFTVAALRIVGVPVHREGLDFNIPSGRWSVVEACSGLRYLTVSFMVGCLYAYLTYRSTRKRVLFAIVSLIVPIVANWLRAFMIVMLGHVSGNKLAQGVDHFIYGWVFFGIVMLAMFWIGARWREDHLPPPPSAGHAAAPRPLSKALIALGAVAALLWQPLAYALLQPSGQPVQLSAIEAVDGWQRLDHNFSAWQPDFRNPSAAATQSFSKDGKHVSVFIAYYRDQGKNRELVTVTNQLAATIDKESRQLQVGSRDASWTGGGVKAVTAVIEHRRNRVLTWHWYWLGGHMTSNAYVAKAYALLQKLSGRGDDGALVLLYTPEDGARSEAVLEEFARDMGPQILRALAQTQEAER
jgi:exosortase A